MPDKLVFRCAGCGGVNRVDPARVAQHPTCGRCKAALDVSGAPVVVNDAELTALIDASPVPILVDFYADWCGPCRVVGPSVAQVGQENAGRLVTVKVNTDRDPLNAARLAVRGIPALFVFRDGRVVGQQAGALPLHALRSWVNGLLAA